MNNINWNKFSFSESEFRDAIKTSISYRSAFLKLGLCGEGAGYKSCRRLVKVLNLETSHFLGRGHLIGKNHNWSKRHETTSILTKNSSYTSTYHLKNRLLAENLLIYKCYVHNCDIGAVWLNSPLTLQLDHINGDNTDNRIENLRLLCPNCHSQTNTYAGKNSRTEGSRTLNPEGVSF